MILSIFFFFKQKTAYEMRISDWSSDVCSSDLVALAVPRRIGEGGIAARLALDRLEFGADAIPQRLEPVARRLLLGIERDHAAKPFVCLSASASAMPAATATFKERKPGCIGIATRIAAAA